MSDVDVKVVSWNRFLTRNLVIAPEMLGLEHEFQFEQSQIKIKLPDSHSEEVAKNSPDQSRLFLIAFKDVEGDRIPTLLEIISVDVFSQLEKHISIPEVMLTRPPNQYDLLGDGQQRALDEMAKAHNQVAGEAFDLWIRTLRWKSNIGFIGRPEIRGFESGWSTYLLNEATEARFWSGPHILALPPYKPITLEQWERTGEALKLGERPPVCVDLMFDGIEHLSLGDLPRAVVDFAVACEAFMRSKVTHQLPNDLRKAIMRYIDEANIRQVLERLFPESLGKEQNKPLQLIKSTLHQLFDARNAILHSGYKEGLTQAECQKYLDATERLIAI